MPNAKRLAERKSSKQVIKSKPRWPGSILTKTGQVHWVRKKVTSVGKKRETASQKGASGQEENLGGRLDCNQGKHRSGGTTNENAAQDSEK